MHRDISHSNVMYRTLQDRKVVGVLNDFDLASVVSEENTKILTSTRHIGTKPFMAIDLLSDEPVTHLYRHDLESLLWVMVWHVHRYDDGEFRGDQARFEDWTRASTSELAMFKRVYVCEGKFDASKAYQAFKPLVFKMRVAFRTGIELKSDWEQFGGVEIDNSTLGGNVTFDVFEDLFVRHRPV